MARRKAGQSVAVEWTAEAWGRDNNRAAEILATLSECGVDRNRIETALREGRQLHENLMRRRGFFWLHPWMVASKEFVEKMELTPSPAGEVVGCWEMHPNARILPTPAQRRRALKRCEWLSFDLSDERSKKVLDDLDYLENAWGAYDRPNNPRGRPQAGIAECLTAVRALLPRQSQHPLWEFVATLGRTTFPEALGPDFDGRRAKNLVLKQRQRRTRRSTTPKASLSQQSRPVGWRSWESCEVCVGTGNKWILCETHAEELEGLMRCNGQGGVDKIK